MGGLGNGDGRTPFDHAEFGDANVVGALEGERRRAIGYRGKVESAMFVVGAGMGLVVAVALVLALVRAVL